MQPLRIGILGAARITERAVLVPARDAGHRLVAVAARDPRRAADVAHRHGIERVHDHYADVLADPDVEVVYNPLPNGLHGPWNLAAVRAGKHVLTEKPFASNADEAREVRAAATAAGVTVVEAFHYRHHPLAHRLRALLADGELGELRTVEAEMSTPAPADDDPRWSAALAGGALMDLGCYSLHLHRALAPWAGGAPRVRTATAAEWAPGVDRWLEAELAFPGGATGRARCDMAAAHRRFTCRITGSRGSAEAADFVLPHTDDRLTVTTGAGTRVEHLGRRSSYAYQLDALAAHLRDGAPIATDVDDAVDTMQLIDDCYRAAGLGPRPRAERP
ncbi:Gfo/Idh/MocA family protein [Saccharopolyspora sp. CA-218241]|uniref:Gfo/Idh/MocA family protein n=1 Tax=Saccharopolyspora sp. CA-218241 TaxID=3240027 RepID=UPI003D99361F